MKKKRIERSIEQPDYNKMISKFLRFGLVFGITLLIVSQFIPYKLVIFFTLASLFNTSLQKFVLKRGLPADFELSTFLTVLTAMAYGLKYGIIVAILSKLVVSVGTSYIVADHFFMIVTYVLAAVISFVFRGGDVLFVGLVVVVINCIVMFIMSKNILGIDITSNISYTGTNFIFNSLVFLLLSRLIFPVILP
jgi:hypothetical protein